MAVTGLSEMLVTSRKLNYSKVYRIKNDKDRDLKFEMVKLEGWGIRCHKGSHSLTPLFKGHPRIGRSSHKTNLGS